MTTRLGSGERRPELFVGTSGGRDGKTGDKERGGSPVVTGRLDRVLEAIDGIKVLFYS